MKLNDISPVWRWTIGAFIFLIVSTVLLWFLMLNSLDAQLKAELQKVRDKGYPATLEELDAWYPEVTDGENAADIYKKAFVELVDIEVCDFSSLGSEKEEGTNAVGMAQQFKPRGKMGDKIPICGMFSVPAPGDPLSDEVKRISRFYLDANAEAIAIIKQASKVGRCRFPVDLKQGAGVLLPHLSNLRQSVRLLSLESLLAAEDGDAETCTANFEVMQGVASSLDREPIFVSYLVQTACIGLAINSLENAFSHVKFSDVQLLRISQALNKMDNPEGLTRALAGEQAMLLVMDWKSIISQNRLLAQLGETIGFWKSLKIDCIQLASPSLENTRKPFPMALEAAAAEKKRIEDNLKKSDRGFPPIEKTRSFLIESFILPFPASLDKKARCVASVKSALAAAAVERYRLKYDRLPESLDALVPEFLDAVPEDPFTGGKLSFIQGDLFYVVSESKDEGASPGAERKDFVLNKVKEYGGKPERSDRKLNVFTRKGYAVYSLGINRTDEKGLSYVNYGDVPFRVAMRPE